VDWSKLPELGAVALLACAFASVARRSQTTASRLWLTGWVMIALHFSSFIILPFANIWGTLASIVCVASLVWAGLLFMLASVPYHSQTSSHWMMGTLLAVNTLYLSLLIAGPAQPLMLDVAACLIGLCPLVITLLALPAFNSALRWSTVCLYGALSIFLLAFQHRPGNGGDLALNAVLFTVYLGCCINFVYSQRLKTTGALITFAGFLSWASVFVLAPWLAAVLPNLQLEDEVWNLPKYVVAVGMILLFLEYQIEHNKYLALHDELTGLPNRRLFQDRLTSALERARRSGTQTALLLIDLDRFKQVNDALGHHCGDLLLQRVAAILSGRSRRTDTVARTGGDEFSIILEEPASREDAERVVRALTQLLEEPITLGEQTVQIGASIGIAVFPDDASAMESLCIKADLRMYASKTDSRQHLPALARSRSGPEAASRHCGPRRPLDIEAELCGGVSDGLGSMPPTERPGRCVRAFPLLSVFFAAAQPWPPPLPGPRPPPGPPGRRRRRRRLLLAGGRAAPAGVPAVTGAPSTRLKLGSLSSSNSSPPSSSKSSPPSMRMVL
jgi:diguanylate cyclase (GGDEF)-like protein